MKHCGTNQLDLWRVFLGRSEIREVSSQALNGSLLVNRTKMEVQCHLWLWNPCPGCFPSCPHPLTPPSVGIGPQSAPKNLHWLPAPLALL